MRMHIFLADFVQFFGGVFSCAPILRGRMTFAFGLCLHLMFKVTWVERLLKTMRGDRQSMPRVPLPVPVVGRELALCRASWVGG